ncbi:hypothetical protein KFO32_22495 (plasmid) [Pantoea ananatis]|uniref:hypothetical protein n=1 Tax=Pantoea ananas TaxID=553 RepID=UPI001FF1FAA1|nr:hypothetical protein [Pantoea ananatis]MCK0555809.1 hypothetical protein [Pantoea ananatis]USL60561.1 hypothetical protein IAQ00_23190 [Pantoea ananatis]
MRDVFLHTGIAVGIFRRDCGVYWMARNMQKDGGGLYAALCSYRDMVLPRHH